MKSLTVLTQSGAEMEQYLPDMARLRIRVFREFPYLYDGDLEYETRYLKKYLHSRKSVAVLALEGKEVVGVSTGLPLEEEAPEVIQPFRQGGQKVEDIFYFSESVLLPEYRGKGLGHRFFRERERHVRKFPEYKRVAFCSVVREEGHPRRPSGYRSLDEFWKKKGFYSVPQLVCEMSWKELDEEKESPKKLSFWMKDLI